MRTTKGVLEEYQKGDFHQRLNLYLEHRELRPRFMQIDLDKAGLPHAEVSGKKTARILVAIDSIRYRLARCWSP
ncbi:MAG: hypothetical protein AB1512_18940 [Thermodesulfobacteriota bacterium]